MSNLPPRSKSRRPQSAQDLLSRVTQGMARVALTQGAATLEDLRQRLAAQLPPEVAPHVSAVIAKPAEGSKAAELVVFVDGAAWAARLKLLLAEQRPQLAPQVPADALIKVKVMPCGSPRR